MTIVEFIEARTAEEERWAHGIKAQRELDESYGRITVRTWLRGDPWPLPGDPARVLRECASKRTIIHVSDPAGPEVEALAAVYSDHPDYDPAWSA